MVLARKGYSIVMWTSVIAVVIASAVILQERFTNALSEKAARTAEYVLWPSWGGKVDFSESDDYDNSRQRSIWGEARKIVRYEDHAGRIKTHLDPFLNRKVVGSASSFVGDSIGDGKVAGEDLEKRFLDKVPLEPAFTEFH